jgi:predicted nucleic acid-binding protein
MRRVLVTDASVVVDLLGRFAAEPIEEALFRGGGQLVAPELLDIEVLHTLRRLEATNAIPASRRARVLEDFRALPIRRFRHAALWQDVWQLRKNLTAYDACYVALAHQLEAILVTRDERIARAPGLGINIEVV